MSLRAPSYVSPTTGSAQIASRMSWARAAASTSASRTTPTLCVFVMPIAPPSSPASRIHSSPVSSPLPLSRCAPAKTGSVQMSPSCGTTTVTPVRTGPVAWLQRTLPGDEGRVPDANAGDVGDGVERTRLHPTDADAELTCAHPPSLAAQPKCPTERPHPMRRTGALILVLALAACSGQPPLASPTLQASRQAPQEPGSIEDLIAYGQGHADEFGGLYIDPPGGQSVVMLFTANLEMHHESVNQIVPGTRTRQVTHTEAALTELIESLDFQALQAQGIEMVSASVDIIGNQVDLELKTNDPTVELSLELAHSGMLDVTVYPVPGEWANVESGEGWRLVEVVQASGNEAYIVRAATDEAGWTDLWEAIGAVANRPRSTSMPRSWSASAMAWARPARSSGSTGW